MAGRDLLAGRPVNKGRDLFAAPEGLKPGSREYADWAAEQARAGRPIPQISDPHFGEPESSLLDPFVQGTTMGWADELRGAVQGGIAAAQGRDFGEAYNRTVDESRQALERERRANPVGSIAAEVAGAIPTAVTAGGQLAGRGANAVVRAATNLGVGAGQGAVYGAGAADEDKAAGAGSGALVGGAAGVAIPAVVGAVRNVVANPTRAAVAAAPEAAAIKAAGQAGYQAAENSGAAIVPQASALLKSDLNTLLQRRGLILPNGKLPDGTGRIRRVMKRLEEFQQSPMSMAQFQRLRETIADVAASPKAGQSAIGMEMLEAFDGFADSLPQNAFTAPKGVDAMASWQQAKTDWARYKRTKAIEDVIYNARMTPQGDFGTRLRSSVGALLKKHHKRGQGFSDAEVAAMEKFVEGGPVGDLFRAFAQGGGLPAGMMGGLTAGPVGAAAGAGASLGSRIWLDKAAKGAVDQIRANVATPGGIRPSMQPGEMQLFLNRLGIGGAQGASDNPRDALSNLLFGVR